MAKEKQEKKTKDKRRGERPDGLIPVWLDLTKELGPTENGKRRRIPFYGHTRAEAEAKRDAYEEDRKAGAPTGSDKMTVSEWCDTWLLVYKNKLRGTNKVSYEVYVNRLNEDLGSILIRDVREVQLQKSLNKLDGKSTSGITKYKMIIQQIFRRAYVNKIIRDDPAADLQTPEGTSGTHRALERWEAEYILENWRAHRCGLWAMLMLMAGLRTGEMIALDWKDVNLSDRTLTIHQAAEIVRNQATIKDKTKSEAGMRILPICDPLYEALASVPEEKRTGTVCKSARGGVISYTALERGWDGFCEAMERLLNGEVVDKTGMGEKKRYDSEAEKIESLKAKRRKGHKPYEQYKEGRTKFFSARRHDLRYTFATALYDAGIDVKSAQYFMGHSDLKITLDLYTQLSKEREDAARQKTVDFLNSWLERKTPEIRHEMNEKKD